MSKEEKLSGNDANEDIDAKMCEITPQEMLRSQYKIHDLSDEDDRKLFAISLVKRSFAFIQIANKYKESLDDLFDIFEKLFQSKEPLECDENSKYIGYAATPNTKQSLWFYLDANNTLFPALKNKNQSILYESSNYKQVINAYNNYNEIANDAIHAMLESNCKDNKSYIKCLRNLFPRNAKDNYQQCAVYHKYRKLNGLHLNNLAAIHYYGDVKNKLYMTNPCPLHIDFTLITLIIANESGLTVFDKVQSKNVQVADVIKSHKMNGKEVIAVISGLTLAHLTDNDNPFGPIPCRHSVKKSYKHDRISFPLFCYADPNGIIDTSLIRNTANHKIINVAHFLAKNMRGSVNF